MDIPGLSTLYAVHKRTIDRDNDLLSQRKRLCDELMENCRAWSRELLGAFEAASVRWEADPYAAPDEIMKLEQDFLKLNYWSLASDSPLLAFIKEDTRFSKFADACAGFYHSALSVKRISYGDLKNAYGDWVNSGRVGIPAMVELWRQEVERMLRNVATEHMHVRVLAPR